MSDVLTFDIETVPQDKLAPRQKELYKKLMQGQISKYLTSTGNNKIAFSELKKLRGLVMATSPYLGKIVVIGLHRERDEETDSIALTGPEEEILRRFWSIVDGFTGTFVSFNGLDFDAPFIIKRSMVHKIKPTNNNFLDQKKFSKYPHFDVKMVIGNWDKYANGNLDLVCEFLGIPSPKEGSIKASSVEQAFKDGRIQEIGEYCLRDVVSTYLAYDFIKDYAYKPPSKY